MTQTAEKPIQLSYDALHQKFQQKFPTLVAPLEHAKAKLDRGEGASDLATIIKCEVACREEPTAFVYTWTGQTGQAFEYRVLRAFDPTPTRKPEAAQEAIEAPEETRVRQEPSEPPEARHEPTRAEAIPAAEAPVEDPLKSEPEPERPVSSAGLFTALAQLIGDATLLMTLAQHDDALTVNVMPFSDDKETNISAVCVTATSAELDEGFAEVIRVKVEARKSLAEQTEALRAAEKELADAKKAEADTKKAEAEKKKKAAETKQKEEEKKKQEEAQEAEKAKRQEALF